MALAEQLANWSTSGLLVRGFVDSVPSRDGQQQTPKSLRTIPVVGNLDNLAILVQEYGIQELVVATSAVTADYLLEIFRRFGSSGTVNLRLSSGLFGAFTTGLYVKELGFVPLISVNKLRLSPQEAFVKRCADVIGAVAGLLMLSPLFAVIAVAVKRDSPGPVIYRRRVLGQSGAVFDAFKFRSMYVDGDDRLTPDEWAELQTSHKLKDDPRITRVGHVIRRYSLDELPQLVNILLGQMSLIGPRMITPAEQEKYGKWDMNLLTVKPGLSGLWQISGRSDVSYEERVNMDMQYIRNYSPWLDIQLFFRTIGAVIKGEGAY
jgi:exopolysaccharide biosynthesis polyprenyl glycosylphosphotransferase